MNWNPWKILSAAFIILIFTSIFSIVHAQEVNINSQLRLIESGQVDKARDEFNRLKQDHPKDPSILYLDALLTADAKDAVAKYTLLNDRYPHSTYADAALYKVYSYYYALGLYSSAKIVQEKLSKSYPQSPYVRLAEKRAASEPFVGEINLPVKEGSKEAEKTSDKKRSLKISEQDGKKFTIQAGAFLNAGNARKLKETFIEDGYLSEIKLKDVAGSALSVVSVGSFPSEEEAKAALLLINERYKLNGRVIPLEQ